MNGSTLVGNVYLLPLNGSQQHYRIVSYLSDHQQFLVFPLRVKLLQDNRFGLAKWTTAQAPQLISEERIRTLIGDQAQSVIELPASVNRPLEFLTNKQREKYLAIVGRLGSACEADGTLWSVIHRTYNARIKSIAEAHHVSRLTVGRELATYFQVGLSVPKAALLQVLGDRPRSDTQDSTSTELTLAKPARSKRGRPRKEIKTGHFQRGTPAEGNNTSPATIRQIEFFLRSNRESNKVSQAQLYRQYVRKYVEIQSGVLADGTPLRTRQADKDIRKGTFQYYVNKFQSPEQRQLKKVGRKNFLNNHRTLTGTAHDGVLYPGQCYIIDATMADVYLVSAIDRKLNVGRPIIYVVIDAFSSLILAVHVTLETANGDQARVALFKAVADKQSSLESIGRSSLQDALPQGVVPTSIYADRGELLSESGRTLCSNLGIELKIAAPYMANWKSLVERYFKIINELTVNWVPGAVRNRERERGERDVRLDAVLTIPELQRLMLSLAAEWNTTHDMRSHVSCQMLRESIDATPIAFWNYGIRELHSSPRCIDHDDAIRHFLPTVRATINRLGITSFTNLRYKVAAPTDRDELFELRGTADAALRIDPNSAMHAFLADRVTGKFVRVVLVDTRLYGDEEISMEDIRVAEEFIELSRSDISTVIHDISATEGAFRDAVVRKAKGEAQKAKQGDERSKRAQVGELRENRNNERMLGVRSPALKLNAYTASPTQIAEDKTWNDCVDELFNEDKNECSSYLP